MTKAEVVLWTKLREANVHGFKFRWQHPVGLYIADFAHVRGLLIVEIDGETHWSASQLAHDRKREDFLRAEGWSVVRFTNQMIYENVDGVVERILQRIAPHPTDALRPSTSPVNGRG